MTTPSAPLSAFSAYGIELEYMIVDRTSLSVRPIADELLRKAAGSYVDNVTKGRFGWSNELVLHLVEIKNPAPEARLDGLAAGFQAQIESINGLLAEFGAQLMPSAMHPWMNPVTEAKLWPHQNAALYSTYDRIFDAMRTAGPMSRVCTSTCPSRTTMNLRACMPLHACCCRSCRRWQQVPRWPTVKPARCLISGWNATARIRPAFRH